MSKNPFILMFHLFKLIGGFTFVLFLAVLTGTLGFLTAISVPLIGAIGISSLLGFELPFSISILIVILIGAGLFRGALRYVEQYFNHYIAFKLLAILRDKIFTALRRLCPAKLEDKQKGSLLSMITSDIETIEVFYAHTMSPVSIAILVSAFMTFFIGWVGHWALALLALSGYLVVGLFLPLIGGKVLNKVGKEYRSIFSFFNGFFMDSIKGTKEIVLHNRSKERAAKVTELSDKLNGKATKLLKRTAAIFVSTELVISLLNFLALALMLLLVDREIITLGAGVVAVVAQMSSFGAVLALSALPGNLNQTFASAHRVLSLINEEPAIYPVSDGSDIEFTSLEIENLHFAYNKENPVLQGLSLKATTDQIIGIKGPSGCGKSTLLKLIMRFWEKQEGQICLNGIDIKSINTSSLLQNATLISQTTYLFDDTVANNLRIAKPSATMDEIMEACKKASIHEFISGLQDGYETKVGMTGVPFSSGETQRIGVARAFLSDAKLILLDEPTSNVDSENETIILSSLKENKNGRCLILVSHRDSTLEIADKVYLFKDGKC